MKIVNHHAGCCGFQPVRPDGTQWSHVLGLPGGASVHADTPGEILAELIEGYAELPDEDARRTARERHAVQVGTRHQELRIDEAVARGDLDPADAGDADLIALLRSVACRPLGLAAPKTDAPTDAATDAATDGDAGEAAAAPRWDGAVRLVCVTTAYAPYGDLPAPIGNVDRLDPVHEEDYLVSLRRAGALDYWSEAVHS